MMFFSSWLRNPSAARNRGRKGPLAGCRRPLPPRLTALEDRTVPSTYTVTSLADSGPGTLRAGVASGADTVRFAPGLNGTIPLASEIAIASSLTIDGPGANHLTVSGGGTTRVFAVSGGTVTIAGLTIASGLADSSAPNGSFGGAIYHGGGTLSLSRDVLAGNVADGTAAGDIGWGGGVFNAAGA